MLCRYIVRYFFHSRTEKSLRLYMTLYSGTLNNCVAKRKEQEKPYTPAQVHHYGCSFSLFLFYFILFFRFKCPFALGLFILAYYSFSSFVCWKRLRYIFRTFVAEFNFSIRIVSSTEVNHRVAACMFFCIKLCFYCSLKSLCGHF